MSLSAVGAGGSLEGALERALSYTPDVVEIAVGARPALCDPYDALYQAATRCTLTAHHTLPLLPGANVYPTPGNEHQVARLLSRFRITSYSAHPPTCASTDTSFTDWALAYRETLGSYGIDFAIETMYTPRTGRDRAYGRWPLADEKSVLSFCDWALSHGWRSPLLLDVAHVNIGVQHHEWRWETAASLLEAGLVTTLHISDNDGRRDAHTEIQPGSDISRWLGSVQLDPAVLVIDEGRRT